MKKTYSAKLFVKIQNTSLSVFTTPLFKVTICDNKRSQDVKVESL